MGISSDQLNKDWNELFPELKYFGKTREELEEILPEGAYTISSGTHNEETGERKFFAMTGKKGYINYILTLQEHLNEWEKREN